MDPSKLLNSRVPAPVSGSQDNIQKTDRTRPILGRSSPTEIQLSVTEETPQLKVDDAVAIVRPGSVLGIAYFNLPRLDTYYFRALARVVRKHVREFNIKSPGRSFFQAYPELALCENSIYALDDDAQTEALIHALRVYIEEVTYLLGAMANLRMMATVGSDSAYARYSAPLRWSRFNAQHRFANGFPIPKFILDYITEATRPLADVDVNGTPVAVFPQWRVDDAGFVSQATAGQGSWSKTSNAMDLTANTVNEVIQKANLSAKGIRPNGQAKYHATAAGASSAAIILPDPASFGSDGYIPAVLTATSQRFLNALRSSANSADFKQTQHPLNEFFTKVIPILDAVIDIENLDRAIRDNAPGSISAFTEAHMTFGLGFGPTLSHVSRATYSDILHTSDVYVGMYLSTNDDYAAKLALEYAFMESDGTTLIANSVNLQKFEPYYAARVVLHDDGSARAKEDVIRIGNINDGDALLIPTLNLDERGVLQSEVPHTRPFDNTTRIAMAFGDSPNDYPPASFQITGIAGEDIIPMLSPGSVMDKPFVVREEFEAGVQIVRSLVTPLIDRWDPSQCGIYLVLASDASLRSHWGDYIVDARAAATRLSILDAIDTAYDAAPSQWMDRVFWVGDGILLGPDYMQARPNTSVLLRAANNSATNATTALQAVMDSEGLWLTKPYTLEPPSGLVQYNAYDPDEADAHHLLSVGGGAVDLAQIGSNVARSPSYTFRPLSWLWWWKDLLRFNDYDETADADAYAQVVAVERRLLPYSLLPTMRVMNAYEAYARAGEVIATAADLGVSMPQFQMGSSALDREEAGRVITLAKPKFVTGSRVGGSSSSGSRGDRRGPKRPVGKGRYNKTSTEILGTPSEDNPFNSRGSASAEPLTSSALVGATGTNNSTKDKFSTSKDKFSSKKKGSTFAKEE